MQRTPILMAAGALMLALTACLGRTPAVDTEVPQPTAVDTVEAPATTEAPLPTSGLPTATVAGPTEAPSQTPPAATDTPAATATGAATAAPTATTGPATPDPNEAVGDITFSDKLDGTSGWFWTFSDEVATFGVVDGKLKGAMKAANAGWRFTISPDTLNNSRQQIRLTARTVACGDNDEYGLMYQVKPEADKPDFYDGYLFKLRCSGAARVDLVQGTQSTPLVDWTPSGAIKTGAGADNSLLIWSAGGEHRFYVNDQYLFTATDSTLPAGFYGVYLYDRTAGGLTATFDNLEVRSVTK